MFSMKLKLVLQARAKRSLLDGGEQHTISKEITYPEPQLGTLYPFELENGSTVYARVNRIIQETDDLRIVYILLESTGKHDNKRMIAQMIEGLLKGDQGWIQNK